MCMHSLFETRIIMQYNYAVSEIPSIKVDAFHKEIWALMNFFYCSY